MVGVGDVIFKRTRHFRGHEVFCLAEPFKVLGGEFSLKHLEGAGSHMSGVEMAQGCPGLSKSSVAKRKNMVVNVLQFNDGIAVGNCPVSSSGGEHGAHDHLSGKTKALDGHRTGDSNDRALACKELRHGFLRRNGVKATTQCLRAIVDAWAQLFQAACCHFFAQDSNNVSPMPKIEKLR